MVLDMVVAERPCLNLSLPRTKFSSNISSSKIEDFVSKEQSSTVIEPGSITSVDGENVLSLA